MLSEWDFVLEKKSYHLKNVSFSYIHIYKMNKIVNLILNNENFVVTNLNI